MPDTFPNQKMVIIHRDRPKSDFLQISNEHWIKKDNKQQEEKGGFTGISKKNLFPNTTIKAGLLFRK